MKKFMFVLAVISAINITACSSDDDGGSETQGNSDCETCNLELLGESLTTEFCDNGDGTITVTVFGESEIEDLEGVSFDEFISAYELLGATCN
jgi:hypothetical protein